MTTSRHDHWETLYDERDEHDASWYQLRAEPSLSVIARQRDAAAGGIIDIGAGASRLVDGLLDAGYRDITLLDISGEALRQTLRRLGDRAGEVSVATADITRWQPQRRWGIWHDRAVFHFLVDTRDRKSYLGALARATEPGSVAIIATFALDGPDRCSGLPVQRYSAESLHAQLGAGFELVESMRHAHMTPAGREQMFTFAVFRRLR